MKYNIMEYKINMYLNKINHVIIFIIIWKKIDV